MAIMAMCGNRALSVARACKLLHSSNEPNVTAISRGERGPFSAVGNWHQQSQGQQLAEPSTPSEPASTNGQSAPAEPAATPPPESGNGKSTEEVLTKSEFNAHMAGLRKKMEADQQKALAAVVDAYEAKLSQIAEAKPATTSTAKKDKGAAPEAAPSTSPEFEKLMGLVQKLVERDVARETQTVEQQYSNALSLHAHLNDAQKGVLRKLWDAESEKPSDVGAWVGEQVKAAWPAPTTPATKETTMDPTKPPASGQRSSASDAGAPTGAQEFAGVLDMPRLSRDEVMALRQQGRLLEKVREWRDTLPGGKSNAIFRPKDMRAPK